ncbi:hypothetical protein [Cohnella sp.]|uniref:hypothetical protein n=1 Tax=Cohnella sp. TaxID=1883426 RepID=UPI003566BA41
MSITVILPNEEKIVTSPQEMAAKSGHVFPIAERVPEASGEGFDLLDWYMSMQQTYANMTHLIVRASDEFQAVIPRGQLIKALLQYSIDGNPLIKGGPLRLYVPDGSSACLNVKSMVSLQFIANPKLGEEASYGFLHEVSQIQIIKGKKSL